jgi:restriction system protein
MTLRLWFSLDTKVYQRFHDVIVPASNGTTQIDHLLISPFGLFVIETKNISGWIFGSEDQPKWVQSLFGKSFSFQNPLLQNYRHTKCLAEYLDIDHSVIHSIVFFNRRCTFKTPMPLNVLRKGLTSYISNFHKRILTEGEILRIAMEVQTLKADPSLTHRNHMRSLRARYDSTSTCPKCGANLIERVAKTGSRIGSRFLGCTGYPRCRYTKDIKSRKRWFFF